MNDYRPPAPSALCRRCRRPLDTVESFDDSGSLVDWHYIHTLLDVQAGRVDHDPDPILRDDSTASAVSVCDFCSAPGPRWRYGCLPFVYTGFNAGSADDWSACDNCHDLIDAARWGALADRALESMLWRSERPTTHEKQFIRRQVLALHQQFAAHRTGPATMERPKAPDPPLS